MRITFLPHAVEQMAEREISEEQARAALENPDREYPGYRGRTVAEADRPGGRVAVKVVYTEGLEGERVVVTVMYGRPARISEEESS